MGNGTAAAPPREAVALILHVRSAVSDQDLGAPPPPRRVGGRRAAGRATHTTWHITHNAMLELLTLGSWSGIRDQAEQLALWEEGI